MTPIKINLNIWRWLPPCIYTDGVPLELLWLLNHHQRDLSEAIEHDKIKETNTTYSS